MSSAATATAAVPRCPINLTPFEYEFYEAPNPSGVRRPFPELNIPSAHPIVLDVPEPQLGYAAHRLPSGHPVADVYHDDTRLVAMPRRRPLEEFPVKSAAQLRQLTVGSDDLGAPPPVLLVSRRVFGHIELTAAQSDDVSRSLLAHFTFVGVDREPPERARPEDGPVTISSLVLFSRARPR
jgi:hypothetical protein